MNKFILGVTEFFVVLSILFSTFSIGYVAYVFFTRQVYFSDIYSNTCVIIQDVLNQQKKEAVEANASVEKQPADESSELGYDYIDEQVEHLTRLQELEKNSMTMDLIVFIYGLLSSAFVGVGAYYIKKMKEESNKIQNLYNAASKNLDTSQKNFEKARNKLSTAKKTYSKAQKRINDAEAKIELTEKNISDIKDELEAQKETAKVTMDAITNDCELKQKAIDDFHINIQNVHKKIPYYDALQTANLVLTICFQCEKLNSSNIVEKSILANMLPRFNDTIKFLIASVKNIEKESNNETDVLLFVLNEIKKSIERCSKINNVFFSEKYVQKVKEEIKQCSNTILASQKAN